MGLQQFLPLTQSPLVFVAKIYADVSSQHWKPGLGEPGVGLGLLAPEIYLPNFYLPHVGMGPVHSVSAPLLPVWMDVCVFFFNSIVVRGSFNSVSDGSE